MKNLLENRSVYLCGPIEDSKDDGKGWRTELTEDLKEFSCDVINPMLKEKYFKRPFFDHREYQDVEGHVSYLKEQGKFDEYAKAVSQIRHEDLRLVDKSDFVIVRYFSTVSGCGTWEELFLANREKKPVLLWANCDKKNVPGWLFGTIPHQHMFFSKRGLIQYLSDIDSGNFESYDRSRWIL